MTALLASRRGRYRGTKTLYDPNAGGVPVASPSTLEVVPYAGGRFHGLRYTWSYPAIEGDQDGLLLVGENDDGAFVTWIDSWHNGRNAMRLTQDLHHDGNTPLLRGTFPAPLDPSGVGRSRSMATARRSASRWRS